MLLGQPRRSRPPRPRSCRCSGPTTRPRTASRRLPRGHQAVPARRSDRAAARRAARGRAL